MKKSFKIGDNAFLIDGKTAVCLSKTGRLKVVFEKKIENDKSLFQVETDDQPGGRIVAFSTEDAILKWKKIVAKVIRQQALSKNM